MALPVLPDEPGKTAKQCRSKSQFGLGSTTNQYAIELSYGTEAHAGMYEDYKFAVKLLQPFFIQTGVATQEEQDQNYEHWTELRKDR